MKTFRKTLSIVLCLAMLICVFAGCGGKGGDVTSSDASSATSSATSSQAQTGNVVGLGGGIGSKFALTSPAGTYAYLNTIDVSWNGVKDGETVTLKIEKKSGNSYTTVLEKKGLTGNSYKSNDKLANNTVYRFTVIAVAADGTERVATNNNGKGVECTILNLAKNTTVNAGMDFAFNGKISETVLNNYLSRAMTYVIQDDNKEDAARAILNVGAKYICRTTTDWFPSLNHEKTISKITDVMDVIHTYDPDVVFEACIFETCGPEMNNIKIPEHVFKAFGKKAEDRCFDYNKMLYPDGYAASQWNETHSVPDITRVETQMFFYYRACFYIDNGFESLHLGQTGFMGKNDPNREAWTKVVKLIREYAKTHARRKYVFINCHYPGQKFVGTDGVMLADFNVWPLRPKPVGAANSNPQKCELNFNMDTPYKNVVSGKSPSGWSTSKYPYLLEFDNYSPDPGTDYDIWGYDEISWIASQPDAYRRSFFTEVRKMVSDLKQNGHVALPGSRSTASAKNFSWYCINNKNYCKNGFSDEDAVIAAFKAYK